VSELTHTEQTEIRLRNALTKVLANAMVYPEGVAHAVLGRDMSNVVERAVEAVLNTGLIEEVHTLHERPLVDRVEVIDGNGRAYTNNWVKDVSTSLQDQGRTLKVFVSEGEYT
jgi:hypothetical protein